MDIIIFLGLLAAACTTTAFFPQVYKVYRTKLTRDLSMPMYIIFSVGTLLWLIYGFAINNLPIMLANGITFISCLYVLIMMFRRPK